MVLHFSTIDILDKKNSNIFSTVKKSVLSLHRLNFHSQLNVPQSLFLISINIILILFLGIDLVTIKPIKNVTTIQADITTDKCRQVINLFFFKK